LQNLADDASTSLLKCCAN